MRCAAMIWATASPAVPTRPVGLRKLSRVERAAAAAGAKIRLDKLSRSSSRTRVLSVARPPSDCRNVRDAWGARSLARPQGQSGSAPQAARSPSARAALRAVRHARWSNGYEAAPSRRPSTAFDGPPNADCSASSPAGPLSSLRDAQPGLVSPQMAPTKDPLEGSPTFSPIDTRELRVEPVDLSGRTAIVTVRPARERALDAAGRQQRHRHDGRPRSRAHGLPRCPRVP